jgi:hypothetical protein
MGSMKSWRSASRRSWVLATSTAMNRLWPTTSAARIAASLRAINSVQPNLASE